MTRGWLGRALNLDLGFTGPRPVYYLNGGIRACLSEGIALEQTINQPSETSPQPRHYTQTAGWNWSNSLARHTASQIWDARSLGEYQGWMRASLYPGHIPGARHLEWSELYDPARGYRIRHNALQLLVEAGL